MGMGERSTSHFYSSSGMSTPSPRSQGSVLFTQDNGWLTAHQRWGSWSQVRAKELKWCPFLKRSNVQVGCYKVG